MERSSVAIVTGGASGVGAATVKALVARGVRVVSVDRAEHQVPGESLAVVGDVVAEATWTKALAAADALGGPPDKLVVNAARLVVGTVLDVDAGGLRETLEVNVVGAYRAVRACLPSMIERGGGAIVTVASTASLVAEQGLAAYCASKGALLQLTRCVAVDHARQGIRANCVCPGAIDTPFFREHVDAAPDPAAFLAKKEARHPSGRILSPEEVAATIDYLLSPPASGINGSAVTVDGGLLASFDFSA
ncbi:SDR family NAD(P)-dependent oxidoreductase [Actinomadura viridis]|uniref:SDR family NAD(P)-dependent oxidoreductase n=1 Tax=Actinomadura viridis TaxID=58110 RepID=UPI00367670A5